MLGTRVGTVQTVRNFLADLNANQTRLATSQHQYSTGKKVDKPADDPVGVGIALGIRNDIDAVNAWRGNIADSLEWMNTTETALGDQTSVIHRARELALQGANGVLSPTARGAVADQIDQLLEESAQVGNAQLGGRYLFAGTAVNTAPFTTTPPGYSGPANAGLLTREVGQAQTFSVNITADRFADPPGGTPDIFTTLKDLSTALRSGDLASVSGTALNRLDDHLKNLSALRSENAAKINRMESTLARYDVDDVARRGTLSHIEDADMAEVAMNLMTRENVLKSSLALGARIMQPSLADFLR